MSVFYFSEAFSKWQIDNLLREEEINNSMRKDLYKAVIEGRIKPGYTGELIQAVKH